MQTRMKELKKTDSQWAVRMYGTWFVFDTKEEARKDAIGGIMSCEGSERDRFCDWLCDIESGIRVTDTDN